MVLSEPFGRIEARTTYWKVPPRKRPALGRRYRPEQDFSSGLRRRDDRRTGTPDPCSEALHGRELKARVVARTFYIVETTGNGVAIFDFDSDGLPDIFLVNSGTLGTGAVHAKHFLYHNLGGLKFEDVTEKAGIKPTGWGQGV